MTDTCKIDGQIQEVDRLLKEGRQNISSLEERKRELVSERNSLLDGPLNHLREVFGSISGAQFNNNGPDSPQVRIPIASYGVTFYKVDPTKLVKYPIRIIDIRDGEVRLCFNSRISI